MIRLSMKRFGVSLPWTLMKTTSETPNRCEISGILKLGGKKGGIYMGVSENSGTPKSSISNRVFHYKPSILGYLYSWKHPHIPPVMVMMVIFCQSSAGPGIQEPQSLETDELLSWIREICPKSHWVWMQLRNCKAGINFVYGGITLPLQLLLIGPSPYMAFG